MARRARRGFSAHRFRFTLSCYALLLAPLALLTIFVYLPVLWAFSKSLYAFEVGAEARYVGFDHYAEIFTRDPVIYPALFNMLFLTLFAVCVRLTVPLVVAKIIHSLTHERARYLWRIVFLAPIVVPSVAVQLIWAGTVYSERGLFNEILRAFGLEALTRGWLNDPATALLAVAFVGFPFVGGFETLIYYAGLSSIPSSVNEAAKLEGCDGIRKFILIDVPMVMSQLKLILILTVIWGVQTYDGIFIMTRGGPGFETTVPGLWMYLNAMSFQRMGYACAIGVCLFVLILGLTILNFRYFKSAEEIQSR